MREASLEGRLRELGERLAFPSVDVAASVRVRVADAPAPRRAPVIQLPRTRTVRRAVAAALAAVLLLGGAALAGRLGVPGLKVIFEPSGATPSPSQVPIGRNLFLGKPTTLAAARGAVGFQVITPHGQDLGPATVYVGKEPVGGRVSLVYPPGPGLPSSRFTHAGLLITQFSAQLDPSFVKKLVFGGTHITNVEVNGDQGLWFSGEPHVLFYVDQDGSEFQDSERLAGNTLVWSHAGVTIRLECHCGLPRALAIAESMR
jgi:hypothetical protein